MFLRTATVRRGSKVYRYSQLVESVRRPGGAVSKKVVASLGQLSELEVANLQAALDASRKAKRVALVVPAEAAKSLRAPDASLRYLDVAALVEVWRDAGFATLLEGVVPRGQADVAAADVIAALVVHRCIAGRSKLHAEAWLPTTSLPELLAIPPRSFHNTRLHRALEALCDGDAEIQRRLPRTYGIERDAVAAFYLDVTDTWFEGLGPALAKPGRAKDDVIRKKIGIVLLCTDDGKPLRWEVLAGDQAEAPAMLDLLRSERWTRGPGPPVVVDRAMGKTAYVTELLEADVPFLTAMTRAEFATYAPKLPLTTLDDVEVPQELSASALAPICDALVAAGMTRVNDDLFLLDLGLVRHESVESSQHEPSTTQTQGVPGSGAEALRVAMAIQADVDAGVATTKRAAGAKRGLTLTGTKAVCRLLGLAPPVREALLSGKANHLPLWTLRMLLRLPAEEQYEAFVAKARTARPAKPRRRVNHAEEAPKPPVRVVGYFNPQIWWQQRQQAHQRLERVQAFIAELNGQLRSPKSRRSKRQVEERIRRYLDRLNHLNAFDLTIDEANHEDRAVLQARLTPNADWKRRRRMDGFSVLVAHPALKQSAAELIERYRAKDVIEKDFQTIKSLVRLRPVWHHNDAKVRAHVTICMLALALERALHARLRGAATVGAALEAWSSVPLQHYTESSGDLYTLTRLNDEQARLLKTANLQHLANDEGLLSRITSRHLL